MWMSLWWRGGEVGELRSLSFMGSYAILKGREYGKDNRETKGLFFLGIWDDVGFL